MRQLIPLLRLVRVHNCLIAGIGVWLGGYLVYSPADNINVFMASLAAALVCGAGNAINDFLDIEIDRQIHPRRPFPKGDLPLYTAIIIALFFSGLALILALMVNVPVLLTVLASIVLLLLYNFKLKKLPLWGNLVISSLSGLTFMVGGWAAGASHILMPPGPVVPAIFAVLFHLGREWLKDINDFEADETAGYKTMPAILSQRFILGLITVLYFFLIFLTFLPVIKEWYSPVYTGIVIILIDIPLLAILAYLWISPKFSKFDHAGKCLKILMVFGLLAFIFGRK